MMRDKKNVVSISYGLNLTVEETVSTPRTATHNVIMLLPPEMAPFQKRKRRHCVNLESVAGSVLHS
jgi:hypothetical protein